MIMKNITKSNMSIESKIKDVKIIPLQKFEDERGWLIEIWRGDGVEPKEIPVMTYVSMTKPGVARGPHEHVHQTDLFGFIGPSTFRIYLWDNRAGSETYGQTMEFEVGENEPTVVIVPEGVVHGYKNVGDKDGLVVNCPNKLYAGEGKKEEVDEIRHEADPDSKFKID